MYINKKTYMICIRVKTLKSMKAIFLIDFLLGTGVYFTAKLITSSLVLATLGSVAGSEGYKWRQRRKRLRIISIPKKEWPV